MDSKLPSLFPRRYYLDIVDDDWIADSLSDDEIEVPIGTELDPNSSEAPSGTSSFGSAHYECSLASKSIKFELLLYGMCGKSGDPPAWDSDGKVDRWTDLGLDLWAKDS